MKIIANLIFCSLILLSVLHVNANQFAGGTGTEEDPFLVESAEHLSNMRNYLGIDHKFKYFRQTSDIDLGVSPWNEGEGWVPVGDNSAYFSGHYDGQEYSINGLFINRSETDFQGLFGYASDAGLTRIKLQNVDVTGFNMVGGLAGRSDKTVITLCSSVGTVSGTDNVGGLVGSVTDHNSLTSSYSSGIITGRNYVGGLVGSSSNNSSIANSYSTVVVTGQENSVGGLAGHNQGFSTIAYCYSTGAVICEGNGGGLIGYSEDINDIAYNFWNIQTSGLDHSAGGIGFLTTQLVKQDNFLEWNFSDIWSIEEDVTYPYLKWQGEPYSYNYPLSYILVITINGEGLVKVSDEEYVQAITVDRGASLSLEAVTVPGWHFDGWTGELTSENISESIIMNGNKAITATFSKVSGIDGDMFFNLKVFPNPFNTDIRLINAEEVSRASIINMKGQTLMVVNLKGSKQDIIDTEKLANGTYLIILQHINGDRTIRKMVKK